MEYIDMAHHCRDKRKLQTKSVEILLLYIIRGESLSLVHPCLLVSQSVSLSVPLSRLSQRGAFASPPSWMGLF